VYLPISPILAGLVDFVLSLLVLVAIMLWYGIVPGLGLVFLVPLTVFAIATALAVGLWLSAINLRYRDVRYLLPFLTQLWLFASPVAYSSSVVPDAWRPWYSLNAMVGVIDGFRWALLGVNRLDHASMLVSVVVVVVLLLGGLHYFHRSERQFADVA
jgi:lipopolysaccharide transport system permease protein